MTSGQRYAAWVDPLLVDRSPACALRLTTLGPVTAPSLLRGAVQEFAQQQQTALMVLDVRLTRSAGLATIDLTSLLPTTPHLAAPVADWLSEVLQAEVTVSSVARARALRQRLRPGEPWRRPALSACVGNAADLFPL